MDLIDRIVAGEQELTLLCIEGSIIHGPSGTGMYDSFEGRPKKEIIRALCNRAEYVLAMGSCATFGGIPAAAPNPTESTGLQFKADKPGGLLGPAWRSRGGLPVINLAGCPVDAATMIKTMWWTLQGLPLELDNLNRPFSVQPCLSDGVNRKCGFADKVGYSCFGCIGAKFPLSKPLFRHVAHEPNGKSVNDPNERACTNHSCHAPSGLYGLHLIRRPQAEQRVGIETPVPT
jgi:Ni,Fe-hydrogenase I small subunit